MKTSASESNGIARKADESILLSIPVTDMRGRGREKGAVAKKMSTNAEITAAVKAASYIRMQELRDSLINILIRRPEGVLHFSDLQTLTRAEVSYDFSNHSFCIRGKTVPYQRDILEHMQRHDLLRDQAIAVFGKEVRGNTPYFVGCRGESLFTTDVLPGLSPNVASGYLNTRDKLLALLVDRYRIDFETMLSWQFSEVQKLASFGPGTAYSLRRKFEEVEVACAFIQARGELLKAFIPLTSTWSKQQIMKINALAFISLTGESLTGD
jgi:hypothetical protein